ncbi:MAG: bifunctional (p)ppGpp synthetase/guanosine-3',5'-bis(diphosphate) 3'-pyrophosphohydrolase [Candidatus Muirbacterium halophilum]|nr:bifunctional (p)ppGpp synthetase/guanosine-3',5'-bis(diphosphate) 3'-pyrophosphohydrolase [Candidatus Muirbacterium halophilum]MCK9476626.1 bifunctional (p)ppGpp synthetase/guanosine-3',5'-bis(diphosphate) 3'-pyrophosphohydrolase [Candidatus Muirbacterium halophilum]
MEKELKVLIDNVLSYNKTADIKLIEKAYFYAKEKHKDQKRKSGEPYFIHPYETALIICELKLDTASICAALLHDILEDTGVNIEELSEEFNPTIAHIVDGVTKISKLFFKTAEEQQATNLRKMLFAMIKDIRVILVKLADRLNNMRTLDSMRPDKQKRIAQETLDIYAPLAHRLGISVFKSRFEDLCLKYLEPETYVQLSSDLDKEHLLREKYIEDIIDTIKDILEENEIEIFEIYGRTKHFFSIFRKMKYSNKTLEEIHDLIGIRVITSQVKDCYAVLGFVHKLWPPIPGRFKDYIAMPKTNFYQSLHTTIMHPMGFPVEFQIRTQKMHDIAEVGVAAHFEYKEKETDNSKDKILWLRQLLEWHKDIENATDFLESVKLDLFADEVFIFTPEGDVKSLPKDSTPLDFAFAIHTEIGSKCIGAKVNGKLVPLTYQMQNGDIVEINTSNKQTPKREWLDIVQSPRAKNKIRSFLRKTLKDENIIKGQEGYISYINTITEKTPEILEIYTKNQLLHPQKDKEFKNLCQEFKLHSEEEFFVAIALKSINLRAFIHKIFPKISNIKADTIDAKKFKEIKSEKNSSVLISDIDSAMMSFAKCCNPIPFDPIIGFITKGKGISIHRKNCPNVEELNKTPERIMDIDWNDNNNKKNNILFNALLRMETIDRPRLLSEVTQIISQMDINISSLNAYVNKKTVGIIEMGVQIKNIEELQHVINTLNNINGINNAYRVS